MLSIHNCTSVVMPANFILVHASSLKFVSSPYSTKRSKVKQQRRVGWTCLILWDPTCNSTGVNLAQYQDGHSAKKSWTFGQKVGHADQNVIYRIKC